MPIQGKKYQHSQHHEKLTQDRNIDATLRIHEYRESQAHAHRDHLSAQRNGIEDQLHDEANGYTNQQLACDQHQAGKTDQIQRR